MSILDDCFQTYASPTLLQWFGVTVTLKRGGRTTEDVPATWSRPPEEIDLEGMPTKLTNRVYRIAVAAYVINGEAVEPRRADVITETINGVETCFEVLPTDVSPAFERDGDGYQWLIRVKKV